MSFMDTEDELPNTYAASIAIFAALAHPIRISIAHCLANRPHTVKELTEHLGVSQPLVSHHLKILREAHVIHKTPQGRTSLHSLADHHMRHIVLDVHEHTQEISQ